MNSVLERSYKFCDLVRVLHDSPKIESSDKDQDILSAYFNDLYKLLVSKLTRFEAASSVSEDESKKLQQILAELINIKRMLSNRVIE